MMTVRKLIRGRGAHWLPTTLLLTLLVTVVIAPSIADAQGRRRRQARATRTINFEDDVVETSYLRPETSKVEVLDTKRRQSLIRLRMHFFAEIIRSAENL